MTRPQRLRLLWSKYPFDGSHAVFMLTERMDRVMAQELASAKSRPDIKVLRKTRESHSAITYSNIPCRILALYLGKKNSLTTIKMTAGSLTLWIACRDRLAQKRKHWWSILASWMWNLGNNSRHLFRYNDPSRGFFRCPSVQGW